MNKKGEIKWESLIVCIILLNENILEYHNHGVGLLNRHLSSLNKKERNDTTILVNYWIPFHCELKVYANSNFKKQEDVILEGKYVVRKLKGSEEKAGKWSENKWGKKYQWCVVAVDPLKNASRKNYEVNGTALLLKNIHMKVLCWVRTECIGLAQSSPWSVERGEPESVKLLNCV